MWNEETVARLNAWYKSPPGAFALLQEHALFQNLVSAWPRRGRTLLDVGCGTGVFLKMFWEYGFEITGVDVTETLLAEARTHLDKADFRLGPLDHLPFDDGEFDYVALLSVLEYADDPGAILAEALRVAARGVVLGFMNAWSLYRISAALPWQAAQNRRNGRWMSAPQVVRILRAMCPDCRITTRSALFGPPGTWKNARWAEKLNRLVPNLPVGAYMGLRVDTETQRPLTPLLLKAREQALAVCPRLRPQPGEGAVTRSLTHRRRSR